MRAQHLFPVLLAMAIASAVPFACTGTPTPPAPDDCTAAPIPPSPADAAAATSEARSVFAIAKLSLGDTDRAGDAGWFAWKAYGRNVDGRVTTKTSTDVCRLASGASKSTQADGCDGIDNSFGANLLPILRVWLDGPHGTAAQKLNGGIAQGTLTTLLVVDGLGPARDQSALRVALLVSGARGADGAWSVSRDALIGGDLATPQLNFGASYVAGGVLVAAPSSASGPVTLGAAEGARLTFAATRVQAFATLSEDGTTLTNGVLSGIFSVDEVVAFVKLNVTRISSSLCQVSAFESIAQQIGQAADILVDGTQDPTRACDGISFGIGFDATLATLGPVVDAPSNPDPCAVDGGAIDAASDASDAGAE